MRAISRRLFKLEKLLAPAVESDTGWGEMARVRDELLLLAAHDGAAAVDQRKAELDALGPVGLWLETVRIYLRERGFEQSTSESFAGTVARALGIDMSGLRVCIEEGGIGSALLERFGQPGTATDMTR